MAIGPYYRRAAVWCMATAYLLAATVSGMFHDHRGCSHAGKCRAVSASASCQHSSPGQCHSGHFIKRKCLHVHGAQRHAEQKNDFSGDMPGDESAPLSHDSCFVCQFLAEQSTTICVCALEPGARVAAYEPEACPAVVSATVEQAHRPRGPPEISERLVSQFGPRTG